MELVVVLFILVAAVIVIGLGVKLVRRFVLHDIAAGDGLPTWTVAAVLGVAATLAAWLGLWPA